MEDKIIVDTFHDYGNLMVLRDDLLKGGTKSILMPYLLKPEFDEYVYASPVYGAFQIALSIYCQSIGKKATIICAKRKQLHKHTQICSSYGANIIEVPYGYLSVIEKYAREYCLGRNAQKLEFGAHTSVSVDLIAERMKNVIKSIGFEPDEVWCAIGSGTLTEGILKGTTTAKVNGVMVGAAYSNENTRLKIYKYPKKFEQESNLVPLFKSMPNYDLKALEYCLKYKGDGKVLFWNVY